MRLRPAVALIASLAATPLPALELDLPASARRAASETEPYGSARIAVTPWQPGGPQTIWAEGEIHREAWQIRTGSQTTLQILAPLREQLADAGFETIFECEARDCGGFDFRYAADLLPEPAMHVDLGDFRYLAAQRMGADRPDYVTLFVSRAGTRAFVHVTRIGARQEAEWVTASSRGLPEAEPDPAAGAAAPAPGTAEDDPAAVTRDLTRRGRAVLSDLTFDTGSARLSAESFPSLSTLADWLVANPGASVVLVGHTDAEGTLANNIALSRARAEAVRQRLADRYGIARSRVRAEGVGYLAPLDTNATEAGRTRNRRVEVVLSQPG